MTVTAPGALMDAEIREQPARWRDLEEELDAIVAAAQWLRDGGLTGVVFLARGTSDHAALYGQYLVQLRLGLPVSLATPGITALRGAIPVPAGHAVIALSQSGRSPDLIQTLQAAAKDHPTLSITNDLNSPLASAGHRHLWLRAQAENSVAATKSYTAELLTLLLLVEAIAGADRAALVELLHTAADLADALMEDAADAGARLAEALVATDRLVLIGRGLSMASAKEGALKLMETSAIPASGWSAADAKHGPFGQLTDTGCVIALMGAEELQDSVVDILPIARLRGAKTVLIGRATQVHAAASDENLLEVPVLPDETPDELLPMLEILPLQFAALHLSRLRGFDPDRPAGLSKVTQTR